MLDGINRVLNTDCGVDTTKVLELIAKYRNALDQEENALNKVKEARDKCQALQEAKQALNVAQQKYYNAIQELNKQQDKFDEDNTELLCKVSETHHASKDAETRLLNEIRR